MQYFVTILLKWSSDYRLIYVHVCHVKTCHNKSCQERERERERERETDRWMDGRG